jgi:hypothetical protein
VTLPSFLALEPRWLSRDRLYRVFVTPDSLCAAYLAGQVHDQMSAQVFHASFLELSFLARILTPRILARRAAREQQYDALDPRSGDFLAVDKRNFSIFATHIADVVVDRKRSLWMLGNVGAVRIRLVTGKTRKFILPAGQDPGQVAELLQRVCVGTQIIGKTPDNRSAFEIAPTSDPRIRTYATLAIGFFFLGGVFAAVAILRGWDLKYLAIAGLNLVAAGGIIFRAAKRRQVMDKRTSEAAMDARQSVNLEGGARHTQPGQE